MNKEEVIEMLHDIAKTISGFDGTVKGLLKINDYIMKVKENTTTDDSDVKCFGTSDNPMTKKEWQEYRKKSEPCSNKF